MDGHHYDSPLPFSLLLGLVPAGQTDFCCTVVSEAPLRLSSFVCTVVEQKHTQTRERAPAPCAKEKARK